MTAGAEIHLCATCPQGNAIGTALRAAAPDLAETLRVFPCLGGCRRRARLSIAAPGRWGWMFGDLTPDAVPDLLAFIRLWLADAEGLVHKHRRPTALRTAILGRMPPFGSGSRSGAPPDLQDHPIAVQHGEPR